MFVIRGLTVGLFVGESGAASFRHFRSILGCSGGSGPESKTHAFLVAVKRPPRLAQKLCAFCTGRTRARLDQRRPVAAPQAHPITIPMQSNGFLGFCSGG